MSAWIDVARSEDFPPGTVRTVDVAGRDVAVFNVNGEYHAIDDLCTHEEEPLSGGHVDGDVVVCPRHGARFCLRTGAALTPPAYEPVAKIPVRVESGVVQVLDEL